MIFISASIPMQANMSYCVTAHYRLGFGNVFWSPLASISVVFAAIWKKTFALVGALPNNRLRLR